MGGRRETGLICTVYCFMLSHLFSAMRLYYYMALNLDINDCRINHNFFYYHGKEKYYQLHYAIELLLKVKYEFYINK